MGRPGGVLVVPPGRGGRHALVIPAGELVERFSRSSGPGGQGVNTTDSRVELLFDPGASSALTQAQRAQVGRILGDELVGGRVSIVASEHRSQLRNRAAARERLARMLSQALSTPSPQRRPTQPTRSSQQRRLDAKKRRAQVKLGRGQMPDA